MDFLVSYSISGISRHFSLPVNPAAVVKIGYSIEYRPSEVKMSENRVLYYLVSKSL